MNLNLASIPLMETLITLSIEVFQSPKQKILRSVVTKKCRKVRHHSASTVHPPLAGSAPQPTFPRNGQGCQARGQYCLPHAQSVVLMSTCILIRILCQPYCCYLPCLASFRWEQCLRGSTALNPSSVSRLRFLTSLVAMPAPLRPAPVISTKHSQRLQRRLDMLKKTTLE